LKFHKLRFEIDIEFNIIMTCHYDFGKSHALELQESIVLR